MAEEDFLMELKNEALGLGVQFGSYEVDHEIIVDEEVDQQFIKYIKEIETGLLDFNAYPKLWRIIIFKKKSSLNKSFLLTFLNTLAYFMWLKS